MYYWPWNGIAPVSSGSTLSACTRCTSRHRSSYSVCVHRVNPVPVRKDMIKAALAMGLCVAMRPTSIMLWMMLALVYLQVRGGGVGE